ncbi:hypothetical protein NKR19_g6826 [Coniochaeta hoffmannii]|uniref:Uncharacterized protein n=1 Tax=Coniochaeta hoffmannii TaxID=91930 RepID=A0AA38RKS0_9PEZI|nr:hypothetical protein NKR19_g6826 [Coniochaeta hoffmannii]
MADSTSPTRTPQQKDAPPEPPQNFLQGITIYIDEKRIAYRPNLRPDMTVTDLADEAYRVILHALPEYTWYPASNLKDLLRQVTGSHVFVRLENPARVYIRTLAEVEADVDLWDEILDYEFPRRTAAAERWEEKAKGKKHRFEEDEDSEAPCTKRVCVEKANEGLSAQDR